MSFRYGDGWLSDSFSALSPTSVSLYTYSLYGWGGNSQGALGLGNTTYYSSPKQVGSSTTWSQVAGAYTISFGIKNDGTFWSWGANTYGQLGTFLSNATTTPSTGNNVGGFIRNDGKAILTHAFKVRGGSGNGGKGYLGQDEQAFTLSTLQDQQIFQQMAVRRLTPVECERLQGFPDNYTNIKDNCPDGPRYKALGNSMAVPVMKWIGTRIQMVEDGLI